MNIDDALTEGLEHVAASEFAIQRGWHHQVHTEEELDKRWPGAPFGVGSVAKIYNVVRGDVNGVPITAFEYRFLIDVDEEVDQYERKALRHYLVAVVELGSDLPDICAVESRWAEWQPAGDRVATSADSRFGDHYEVHASDPTLVERVLDTDAMERILHRMLATEWRTCQSHLVIWGYEQHVGNDLESLLESMLPVAERLRTIGQKVTH